VQVIVWPKVYEEHRGTILGARLLAVEGVWQRGDGDVRHLLAQGFVNLNPLLGRLPRRVGISGDGLSEGSDQDLIQQRQPYLCEVWIRSEFFNLSQLLEIAIPEGIPLLHFPGRRNVKLPVNPEAFFAADGTEEHAYSLIFALKLPATEAGKCSIAHDA